MTATAATDRQIAQIMRTFRFDRVSKAICAVPGVCRTEEELRQHARVILEAAARHTAMPEEGDLYVQGERYGGLEAYKDHAGRLVLLFVLEAAQYEVGEDTATE